ncbi:MAG: zinc-dependent metalloprotease [Candidatus Velthaea sp.]
MAVLGAAFAAMTVPAAAQSSPAPSPSGSPPSAASVSAATAGAAAAAAAAARQPGDTTVPYETFMKDAVKQPGLFTLIRKDGKVYLELKNDQFDKDYLQTAVPSNGLGGYFVLSGDVFQQEARVIRFMHSGKQVIMLWPQTRFVADPKTPLDEAIRRSTADSVLGIANVVSENKTANTTVIELSAFLGDVADMTNTLNAVIAVPTNPLGTYRLDPTRSFYGLSKAFPRNVVFEADQTFVSLKPSVIDTVVDPRSVRMRMTYNLAELPDASAYMPRFGDDRVGFWEDPHIGFDRTNAMDNTLRYILRWNIKPSDPTKKISPAVTPIVYTLSNTIPVEFREPIRTAVLQWNAAFERIGISDAVKVEDQPNDPNFDPDDIRYNVIRWLTESNSGGFAEAQITWDPRDGQIFRSGVFVDADLVRFGSLTRRVLNATGEPVDDEDVDHPHLPGRAALAHNDGPGAHAQMMYGAIALALMNGGDPAKIADNTAQQYLHAVVLHEVGHDFGLAHNFIGHMAYSGEQIRDRNFTAKNGIASSVMEYNPTNIWPKGWSHGDYEQMVLGPYDYHVIHYGYAPLAGAKTPFDELATTSKWASAWSDPKVRFASDEDVAWAGGHAIDPRVHQWTLTNDPLKWCDTQLRMVQKLIGQVDSRFPAAQHPFDDERLAFAVLVSQYGRCSSNAAHFIGGEYLSRARPGDAHADPPLVPVSRAEERRAFGQVDRYLFSNAAWHFSPKTLSRLVYSEHESFTRFNVQTPMRHDISVATLAATYQNRALTYMFAPNVLARIADLPTKSAPGATMTLADLFSWTQKSVFGDIADGSIRDATQVRRNLQRRYTDTLRALALTPARGTPLDAQALARHELVALERDVSTTMARRSLDLQTRSHLEALHVEADRTLRAQTVVTAEPAPVTGQPR